MFPLRPTSMAWAPCCLLSPSNTGVGVCLDKADGRATCAVD